MPDPWKDWQQALLDATHAAFGSAMTVFAGTEDAQDVDGIVFDRGFAAVALGDPGQPIATLEPVLRVDAAKLARRPRKGDRIDVGGPTGPAELWEVGEVRDDGFGGLQILVMQV